MPFDDPVFDYKFEHSASFIAATGRRLCAIFIGVRRWGRYGHISLVRCIFHGVFEHFFWVVFNDLSVDVFQRRV